MVLFLIIFVILLNGIFVIAEIAFVSANENKLKELSYRHKQAKRILELRRTPHKFLSIVQVGITITGIVSGLVSGIGLAEDFALVLVRIPFISHVAYQVSLVTLVIFITYFSIVFGELIPKTFALRNPEKLIIRLSRFISVFAIIMFPFVMLLDLSVRAFYKITGIKNEEMDENDLIKQISGMTRVALIENKIEKEQERIIKNTIKINKIKIRDIMVKKEDIKYLYSDMSFTQALVEAHLHQHTRYLVFDRTKKATAGYLNFKDIINMIKFNPENPALLSVTRPVFRFNEQEYLIGALKKMTKYFQHIALIVNPQNEEVGLLTLEDVIETIIGDIKDEYDFIPDYLYKIAHNRYIAGGKVKLEKINEEVSKSVPATPDSLNEWLSGKLSGQVRADSRIEIEDLAFIVKKIARSKIAEVIIELKS